VHNLLWVSVQLIVPLVGVGFLLATRRRSRRAATLGIAALIWMAVMIGYHYYFTKLWPMLSAQGSLGRTRARSSASTKS
jgi:hypothetical protein